MTDRTDFPVENRAEASRSGHAEPLNRVGRATNPPAHGGMPQNLQYSGIIVGLILVMAGVGLLIAGKPSVLSSLMTCVGFGIVLASFGSKASGSWAGWTVTGAGATAIVLFLILQQYTPTLTPAKRGQIRGDFSKIADIRIIDETPMYGFRDPTTASIRFVVLDKALKSQRMSVQVDTTEKGAGREFFELVGSSHEITKKYLSASDHENKVIQWSFDFENRVIKDGPTIIFAEADKLDEQLLPKRRPDQAMTPSWLSLTTTARAQTTWSLEKQANPEMISAAIDYLRSDDPSIRRNARDVLAAVGVAAISPTMNGLRADTSDYRLRGGAIYVLWSVLNRNLGKKAAISAALLNEDFPILVAAASDDDRTIRLQAAEFLYQLGDPRAIPYSVDAARETEDNNKAANQVSIISKSVENASEAQKTAIINDIKRDLHSGAGPNNDAVKDGSWLRKRLGF